MRFRAGKAGFMVTGILVAYLLVLQALVGGIALGTHAAMGVALGPGGEIICFNGGSSDGQKDPAGHLPDCCTTGCRIAAVSSLPPPEPVSFAAPLAFQPTILAVLRAERMPDGTGRRPHNARAPPIV